MVIPKSSLQLLLSLFYLWLTLAEGPNVSAQTVKPYTFEEHHMGTLFKITLYAESDSVAELAASNAFQEIERLNNIMRDRKSTRLNSSNVAISYAVFCLLKKKHEKTVNQ